MDTAPPTGLVMVVLTGSEELAVPSPVAVESVPPAATSELVLSTGWGVVLLGVRRKFRPADYLTRSVDVLSIAGTASERTKVLRCAAAHIVNKGMIPTRVGV